MGKQRAAMRDRENLAAEKERARDRESLAAEQERARDQENLAAEKERAATSAADDSRARDAPRTSLGEKSAVPEEPAFQGHEYQGPDNPEYLLRPGVLRLSQLKVIATG